MLYDSRLLVKCLLVVYLWWSCSGESTLFPSLDCSSKDVSIVRQAGGKGRTIVEVVCRPGRKEQKYRAVSLALQGMSTLKIQNMMQAPKTSKKYKGFCESYWFGILSYPLSTVLALWLSQRLLEGINVSPVPADDTHYCMDKAAVSKPKTN